MLHFADVHIGMENYGRLDPGTGMSSRILDFLDRLDEAIDYAVENQADLAVFAGDAFKNQNPEPTQQREFARRIKRLSDEMPVLLLVGNHDMPGMTARANSLDIFRALGVPGVIVGHAIDSQVVETRAGQVFLGWIPYPMRNRLLSREDNVGKTLENLEDSMRTIIADNLEILTQKAESHAMPRVLVGHFSVSGAVWGSERSVMLGRDVPVLKSMLANPAWDYVALGHIHKHQDLNPGEYPSIVYSGSLERIDFGEENETKGFCWVELERDGTTWSFVKVKARAFQTIHVDARGAKDPTRAVLEEIERSRSGDSVVRVLIKMSAEGEPELRERELEDALQGARSYTLIKEVEAETRARLGGLEPETLSSGELLGHYLNSRGVDEERIQKLLLAADEIFQEG
jgi:exonuclease SbcD